MYTSDSLKLPAKAYVKTSSFFFFPTNFRLAPENYLKMETLFPSNRSSRGTKKNSACYVILKPVCGEFRFIAADFPRKHHATLPRTSF
jgi:hypothetical protein